jgi:hypothetical protein
MIAVTSSIVVGSKTYNTEQLTKINLVASPVGLVLGYLEKRFLLF